MQKGSDMNKEIKKFLFLGSDREKNRFFEQAQSAGFIHFIDFRSQSTEEIPKEVHDVAAAIKILRGFPLDHQVSTSIEKPAETIVGQILSLQRKKEEAEEEERLLKNEIEKIYSLGHFSLEEIAEIEKIGKCRVQFFAIRSNSQEPIAESLLFLSSDNGLDYYMSIHSHFVSYEKMIEIQVEHSLDELTARRQAVQQQLYKVKHELKEAAKYNDYLHEVLIDYLNRYHLYDAQSYVKTVLGGAVFAVEGWVPQSQLSKLDSLLAQFETIFVEEIELEPEDIKPTYLENEGLSRLGEDLVHIYDTPSSTDKDPSNWVLYSFALFFAFIIGDAGYGLVYLCLALFLRYKFSDAKGEKKRFINLFIFLSTACVIWGTLLTSFFGMQIDYDNPIRKVSMGQWLAKKRMAYEIAHQDQAYKEIIEKYPQLANESDPNQFLAFVPPAQPEKGHVILNKLVDNSLFELALFIGVIHLILSLLRYSLRTFANVGWAIFLIGGYLHFSASLHLPSFMNTLFGVDLVKGGEVGLVLIWIGVATASLLSIFQNGWVGIFEPMNLIQIFADALSYLRLYALALAGAIVASTANGIAAGMSPIFAPFLIVGSHLINIVLSTMSGVIHGLRLNYLEWYRWSFEGGGKLFKPLKLLQKD